MPLAWVTNYIISLAQTDPAKGLIDGVEPVAGQRLHLVSGEDRLAHD